MRWPPRAEPEKSQSWPIVNGRMARSQGVLSILKMPLSEYGDQRKEANGARFVTGKGARFESFCWQMKSKSMSRSGNLNRAYDRDIWVQAGTLSVTKVATELLAQNGLLPE
jgi:hypothetical protein